jgi:hypothetical protein
MWIGHKVKVVFFDGEKINSKIGVLKNVDSSFVYLKLSDNSEAISIRKIIRMELLDDGGKGI